MSKRMAYLMCVSLVLGGAGSAYTSAQDGEIPSTQSVKPVVDGVREGVWSLSQEHKLTQIVVGSPLPGLGASWWALWDAKYVYVFVDVNDPKVVTDNAASWQDDSVEIYFDGGNRKSTTAGPTDFQYRIAAKPTICPAIEEYHNPATALTGVEYAVSLTDKGYSIEAKFPWNTLLQGKTPALGDFVGFEVHVNNNDGTGAGRISQLTWLTTFTDCWSNPSHLMTIVLVPGSSEGAANPVPEDGKMDVPRDTAALSWASGAYAVKHDVYFGTASSDVNDADGAEPKGVLVSQGQTAATYALAGPLAFGQTYYWRVDEVNAPPDSTVFKGGVWSFTVEPFSYPVRPIKATASSSMVATMGPEKTIDGSGLDASDGHSASSMQMWLSKKGLSPVWIRYEFDSVYKLYQLWVWNSNQQVETLIGFGAKDVTIEYSTDGVAWTVLAGVPEFAQASGEEGYQHNTTVDFGGVQAKYVKLTINANWADGTKQAGLSEVRFFYVPVKAFVPSPATGGADVALDGVLGWRPGREAAKHEVYLSRDPNAVVKGTALVKTATEHSLGLGSLALEYGRTYYWKVNEVNDAAATKVWEGDLWTFATVAYGVVDDFDKYDDACNRVFFAWVDGLGHNGSPDCSVPPGTGNGTGSTVGNINPPFAEQMVTHGGRQSMPMAYDNTKSPFYSEAQRDWMTPQAWTGGGVDTLVVFVRGDAPGFVETSPGTIIMNGMGTDIWANGDQCRFVYKQLKGNGSIMARVDSVSNTNAWAKAGVMIRESLDAGSTHATAVVTPSSGVSFQRRLVTADVSTNTDVTGLMAPYWVKVTRTGTAFTTQCSADGVAWTDITATPAVTITMANDVYIGLAVSSHAAGTVCGARFSKVSTTGGVSGQWQVAEVGAAQSNGNMPETFYVAVQDGAGKVKAVSNADPSVIATGSWEQWSIPLSQFTSAGVNLGSVKRMIVGVGDRNTPKAGAAGKIYIDSIRLTRAATP